MLENKRKIRKERDNLRLEVHALRNEIRKLKTQISTDDEEFNPTDLCEFCKHCRGYIGYWICDLQNQSCKHFE